MKERGNNIPDLVYGGTIKLTNITYNKEYRLALPRVPTCY